MSENHIPGALLNESIDPFVRFLVEAHNQDSQNG